ncbi:MAG: hypothetical protein M4D80_26150 [Myxococcota bacterium]|nr:hypothetical protein [Myxococcota bacterium]
MTAAALCAAAATAEAKPRRVVILDFDGPRSLADSGRTAVVSLLGEQYDIVTKKKWEDARSRASKGSFGPQTWSKASKLSGVDALVEGWVQDEGRHKVLNIVVREASTGREFDTLTFKFGKSGLSSDTLGLVRVGLEDVLDYIEPGIDPSPSRLPEIEPKRALQSKKKAVEIDEEEEEIERPVKKTKRAPVDEDEDEIEKPEKAERDEETVATAVDEDERDQNDLVKLFGNKADEWPLPNKPTHVPKATPRFQIGAGAYYASRSLVVDSEDPQDFLGVGTKGLSLSASVYPFPLKKMDGALSGVGFSVNLYKAPASTTTVQGDDFVADYKIDSGGFDAAVHYRQPLGDIVHIDGHAGYAQEYFNLEQDVELDVPDVGYKYFWAGANVDLNVTDRATVGFGVKYLYVTDNGQISDINWMGPGTASGWALDGNFSIPLPKNLYVRGELKYRRFSMEFDAPDLSAERAYAAKDGTVAGTAHIGIQF